MRQRTSSEERLPAASTLRYFPAPPGHAGQSGLSQPAIPEGRRSRVSPRPAIGAAARATRTVSPAAALERRDRGER